MGGEGCCGSKGVRQRGDARAELYSFVGTLSLCLLKVYCTEPAVFGRPDLVWHLGVRSRKNIVKGRVADEIR